MRMNFNIWSLVCHLKWVPLGSVVLVFQSSHFRNHGVSLDRGISSLLWKRMLIKQAPFSIDIAVIDVEHAQTIRPRADPMTEDVPLIEVAPRKIGWPRASLSFLMFLEMREIEYCFDS